MTETSNLLSPFTVVCVWTCGPSVFVHAAAAFAVMINACAVPLAVPVTGTSWRHLASETPLLEFPILPTALLLDVDVETESARTNYRSAYSLGHKRM